MYIRWLGAFRKNGPLLEAITFEMNRSNDVACEQLQKGKSLVKQARVGLLIDPKAVYKRYSGDVWSKYDVKGNLYPTRKGYQAPLKSKHKEAFAKPVYTGIVIKNASLLTLKYEARTELIKAVQTFDLPIYKLVKGSLVKENI